MSPPQSPSVEEEVQTPIEPSEKARGKRKMDVQEKAPEFLPPGMSFSHLKLSIQFWNHVVHILFRWIGTDL